MLPLARRGKAGVGGVRTAHGRGAGLLQLRSLASYLLLRSSRARPSRPHHARPRKLPQQTLYRALWRLSTLIRLPLRVADMVDEAEEEEEAETEEGLRRLGIREASALPWSKCD